MDASIAARQQQQRQMRPKAAPKTAPKARSNAPKQNTVSKNIKNGVQREKTSSKDVKKKKGGALFSRYLDYIKIDRIGKTIEDSIPITGIAQDGVFETRPGTFTKSYKMRDVNFRIATNDTQSDIFRSYMDLLNSMGQEIRWQVTIFNHEIPKNAVVDDLRVAPQHDGLNMYRGELNGILLDNLKEGRNTLKQEKYLTVSVDDDNADRAIETLQRIDTVVNQRLRKITKTYTPPMKTGERLRLLYNIYNIQGDYRRATDLLDPKKGDIELKELYKQGLNYKSLIAPYSLAFNKGASFQIDDMVGEALFIEKVPASLTTNFLNDLSDVQQNMLISITNETMDHAAALKIVKRRLGDINRDASKYNRISFQYGTMAELPPDIQLNRDGANEIITDLEVNDQNLYFVTIVCVIFSEDREQLGQDVKYIQSIGKKHDINLLPLREQQEQGFNTALPLARNDISKCKIMLTTESASVFLPFSSEELNQKHAIFYGLNQTSRNMIRYDRTSGDNYNEMIFGYSGSGKSFLAKFEMIQTLLVRPDSQVFVIDPQGEYFPLVKALHGSRIELAQGKSNYINPMDMELTDDPNDETNPIAFKTSQILSMIEIMFDASGGEGSLIDPTCKTIIDQCVRNLYKRYIIKLHNDGKTYEPEIAPTLADLDSELSRRDEPQARMMRGILGVYTNGSFDTFAHRTNVGDYMHKRFIVYDIKQLGTGMNKLGLHICINNVWNQMIQNSKKKIYTYFYIDEFHLLLDTDVTLQFVKMVWKMARKWKGCPCGMTQNSEDLLHNRDSREIADNTSMVIMLKSARNDRANFQTLFNISDAQLEYITNSDPGEGLIYNSKTILPFSLTIPKNTELYRIMTTKADVAGAEFA